jgi:RND family efflux transporter MFP subunit
MKGIIIAGFMGIVVLATGCHKTPEKVEGQPLATATVTVQKAEVRKYTAVEEAVGTVRPRLHATISPKVSGRIEKLLVVPGQTVKLGDWLAQVDASDLQARLDQAQAVRTQSEADLQRVSALFKDGTVSRAEFDRAEMQARVARGSVKELETMIGFARVTAPFNGVITRKLADVGDLAAPGTPMLEMEDPATVRLEVEVPEALISRVKMGDRLATRISSVPAAIEGAVTELEPVADAASRTFRVKIDLAASPELRSGLFGRAIIPIGETTMLRVPASALVVRGQMEILFVVANQKAQLRLVKTGKHFGSEVEIISGLTDGETVVTSGAASLVDGQPVVIK